MAKYAITWVLIIRAIQAVFAIIILGLMAYVANVFSHTYTYYDDGFYGTVNSSPPSRVNFMLFNACWTILALVFLVFIPYIAAEAAHKYAILAVDAVTMIFWFAGWIALADLAGGLGGCGATVCNAIDAGAAFGAFIWVAFVATTITSALYCRNHRHESTYEPRDEPAVAMEQRV
ncbi:MAG: hypothetical protein M1834_003069 [Cirrosporium novae-zelandiae]|nr:MAG: hypothetical protein M1834_003069 [Cirrosporium novae-zelandiae]